MALIHMDYHSDVLGMGVSADVILPEKATTQIGMGGKREKVFPTLYLLHGLSDDNTIWQRRTSIERYASRYGIAVVMPNAHRSWYTDMTSGGKYFTFISNELPMVCRSFFKGMSDEREYNYIAGNSMGGYGALKVAMANPERYAGVACFSGAFDVCRYADEGSYLGKRGWVDVLGSAEAVRGTVNDAYGMTERNIKAGAEFPDMYISCGTDDSLFPESQKLHRMLTEGGVKHKYREPEGGHNWDLWDEEIQLALKYFFDKNL